MPGPGLVFRQVYLLQRFRQFRARTNLPAIWNQARNWQAILEQDERYVLVTDAVHAIGKITGCVGYGNRCLLHRTDNQKI